MSEKDYDGILSSIATLINMYSLDKKEICLDFSSFDNRFGDREEVYLAMGVMVANLVGKELKANLGFFLRRKLGKKYGCKIKKLKEKGVDVVKLQKIIKKSYEGVLDLEYYKAKDLIDYYLKTKGK